MGSRRAQLTGVMVAAVAVAAVIAAAVVVLPRPHGEEPRVASGGWARVGGQAKHGWEPAATSLPHAQGAPVRVRAADALPPPTNRWYSGMFFGDTPQPVFALPLAMQATPDGLAVGLPKVSASDTTVSGPFAPELRVGLPTDGFEALRADPVSVTSAFTSSGRRRGKLTIAEGWPYAGYTAVRDQTVTLPAGLRPQGDGSWLAQDVAGTTYGVAVTHRDGSRRTVSSSNGSLNLEAGESLLLFAGPDLRTARVLAEGAVPIRGTTIRRKLSGETALTRITYRTQGGRPTVLASMPHQQVRRPHRTVGTVTSAYGPQRLYPGRTITSSVPRVRPAGTLDLSGLSDADRSELRQQVRADAAKELSGPALPTDTYFGGKSLYRLAQLTRLAEASGADKAAGDLRDHATKQMDEWLADSGSCPASTTRCFYYDTGYRGVVGREASFGADEFNDHHFHYGYFLAAAALLGQDHPDLLDRWRPVLSALSEDVAAPAGNSQLPALRTFDPYAGHSWASGTAPFADGNNQESSSEAVNAWNGLALWAELDGRRGLADQATWQLSLEAASARAYWLEPRNRPDGFGHPFFSLNWGGKRDWATWFSADPSAILGIQVLPAPPVLDAVAATPKRVRANVADATPDGFDVPFGDYVAMYLATADPDRALRIGRGLPDSSIDDGNTRSYLLAWLLAHAREK